MSDQDLKPIDEAAAEDLRTPHDDVAAAFAEVKARETETPEAKAERVRDEAGRFAKAEKDRAAEPERKTGTLTLPPDKVVAVGAPTAEGAQTVVPPATTVKAPEGWSAPMKEKFSALPPDVQAEITRREADMHKQFTRQDEDRNLGKQIKDITTPYAAIIQAEGGNPVSAMQMFLNYAYIMRTGTPEAKRSALLQVAQQYSVDLSGGLQHASDTQQQPQGVQPQQVSALVQAELDKYRQSQESDRLKGEVEAFAASPGHEHFETVKAMMGSLLRDGHAKDLQDAYDRACYADPDIRSTLAAAKTAEAETKRLADLNEKAAAARRASGSVSGGPGGAKPNGSGIPERSLDEELRANMRAALGRV